MASYTHVEIASVVFEDNGDDCKGMVLDAGNLRPSHVAVSRFAADLETVIVQSVVSTVGQSFGVRLDFCPANLLADAVDAINAAMEPGGAGSFEVVLTNEVDSLTVTAIPDYSQNWISYPEDRMDERAVRNTVFRFIRATDA